MLRAKKKLTTKRSLIQLVLFKPDLEEVMSWDGMKFISDGKLSKLKTRFFMLDDKNANT